MRNAFLSRPGAWLCLLGSALALVAFFLPYYGPPPGSLWDMLLLYWSEPDAPPILPVLSIFLSLLLLLLGGVVWLAYLTVRSRSLRWIVDGWYQSLTILALSYYIVVALSLLFLYWLGAELGDDPNVYPQIDIGAWLIPASLVLALIGGTLITRNPRRSAG